MNKTGTPLIHAFDRQRCRLRSHLRKAVPTSLYLITNAFAGDRILFRELSVAMSQCRRLTMPFPVPEPRI